MIYTAMTQDEAYELDECLAEMEAEHAFEVYLENGGPHADRIQAEDAHERDMEAMDAGLCYLRAGRE